MELVLLYLAGWLPLRLVLLALVVQELRGPRPLRMVETPLTLVFLLKEELEADQLELLEQRDSMELVEAVVEALLLPSLLVERVHLWLTLLAARVVRAPSRQSPRLELQALLLSLEGVEAALSQAVLP